MIMESDNEDSAPVSQSSLCFLTTPPPLPQVTPEYGAVSPASSYSSPPLPPPPPPHVGDHEETSRDVVHYAR